LQENKWREGPILPANLINVEYVQLDSGFMAIGGIEDEELGLAVQSAFVMDDEYNWTSYPEAFYTPKYHTMAINVPNDFFTCKKR